VSESAYLACGSTLRRTRLGPDGPIIVLLRSLKLRSDFQIQLVTRFQPVNHPTWWSEFEIQG